MSVCPLCLSTQDSLIERISCAELEQLYRRLLPEFRLEDVFEAEEVELRKCQSCGLGYFDPRIEAPAELYQELSNKPWYYLSEKPEFSVARRFIKPDHVVLDVGCGDAAFAEDLSHGQYVGVDLNPRAVRNAQTRGLKVEEASLQSFSGCGFDEFDVICGFQIVEHMAAPREFVDQALRWTRPGGLIIISVPCADSFISLETNEPLNLPPHHLTWWFDQALHSVSKLFDLDLVWLEHEALSARFRRRYATCFVVEVVRRALPRDHRIVDLSLSTRLIRRFGSLLGRTLVPALENPTLAPRGHSVTAVYRKRVSR